MGWTKASYDALFRWLNPADRPAIIQMLEADDLHDVVVRLNGSTTLGTWYMITREAAEAVGPNIVERSAHEAEAELNRLSFASEITCLRCGHRWYLRTPATPRVCPKCKSPYYDRPRTR